MMQLPVTSLGKGLRVEWIDFYGDFTMHACICNEAGKRTEVCIDGRKNSPTRYRLFQQARHPRKPDASLVELGSEEEGIVIPLLSWYLDSGGPKALCLTGYGWELAQETLLRYGEPPVSGTVGNGSEAEPVYGPESQWDVPSTGEDTPLS
jgi:hypothetical protein